MDEDESGYHTYHMEGGDGPCSYSQNSTYQKQSVDSAKEMMRELINQHLHLGNNSSYVVVVNPDDDDDHCYRIADFGCSVGPNTIIAVQNIVEAVGNKYKSMSLETPEFHAFFNDHVDNDFNSLFKKLPAGEPDATPGRGYFAAGVPGSFHRRLFPSSTLHFVHSSTSLHWLSKIPEEVRDKKSPAWNRGRIHYAGAAKEVKDAYSTQYGKDLECFLRARARELVPAGLMVLIVMGFPEGAQVSDSSVGETFNILGSCFQDMAVEGIIGEELVDSFNLPFYYPSASELKTLVETNGLFEVERVEELATPAVKREKKPDFRTAALHLRAVLEGLIKQHFGEGIEIEDLFQRHFEKCVKNPVVSDHNYFKEVHYFVFLKRKINLTCRPTTIS